MTRGAGPLSFSVKQTRHKASVVRQHSLQRIRHEASVVCQHYLQGCNISDIKLPLYVSISYNISDIKLLIFISISFNISNMQHPLYVSMLYNLLNMKLQFHSYAASPETCNDYESKSLKIIKAQTKSSDLNLLLKKISISWDCPFYVGRAHKRKWQKRVLLFFIYSLNIIGHMLLQQGLTIKLIAKLYLRPDMDWFTAKQNTVI
jgi:hypothetical protein